MPPPFAWCVVTAAMAAALLTKRCPTGIVPLPLLPLLLLRLLLPCLSLVLGSVLLADALVSAVVADMAQPLLTGGWVAAPACLLSTAWTGRAARQAPPLCYLLLTAQAPRLSWTALQQAIRWQLAAMLVCVLAASIAQPLRSGGVAPLVACGLAAAAVGAALHFHRRTPSAVLLYTGWVLLCRSGGRDQCCGHGCCCWWCRCRHAAVRHGRCQHSRSGGRK